MKAHNIARRCQFVVGNGESHFQPVRFHRLNAQILAILQITGIYLCRPLSSWGIGGYWQIEAIQPHTALGHCAGCVQLALRCGKADCHRIIVADISDTVVENESQMQRVAGPPDSALAVNESAGAILQYLAADIEVAG